MKLEPAEALARKIMEQIAPYCKKVEIAGSIRRRRAEVNDIDIVCLPTDKAALRARVLRTQPRIVGDGQWNLEVELTGGVRLDVWMASPGERTLFGTGGTNYGSLLLCRTGSVRHNIKLIEHAKERGLVWDPYWGVKDTKGDVIACETEEQIFKALGLAFVPPTERE